MAKPRVVVASGLEGTPLVGRIAEPPGCRARVKARMRWFLFRLPWLVGGALVGWAASAVPPELLLALLGLAVMNIIVSLAVLVVVLAKG